MNSKQKIRLELLSRRERLSATEVAERSRPVQNFVAQLEEFRRSRNIAFYYPIRGEVLIWDLFSQSVEAGKTIFFPKVEAKELQFYSVDSRDDFKESTFRVPVPTGDRLIPLSEIDCFLVPGIAFDENHHRLGFGLGHYDRTLSKAKGYKIGLAYDFQLLPKIPATSEDVACDLVVTETRTL